MLTLEEINADPILKDSIKIIDSPFNIINFCIKCTKCNSILLSSVEHTRAINTLCPEGKTTEIYTQLTSDIANYHTKTFHSNELNDYELVHFYSTFHCLICQEYIQHEHNTPNITESANWMVDHYKSNDHKFFMLKPIKGKENNE